MVESPAAITKAMEEEKGAIVQISNPGGALSMSKDQHMEKQMMEELEKRKQEQMAEAERREVRISRLVQAILAQLHPTPTGGRRCRVRAPAL